MVQSNPLGNPPLPGSHREQWPGPPISGRAGTIMLTAWLRPREGGKLDPAAAARLGATPIAARSYRGAAELSAATSFDPADLAAVAGYFSAFNVTVVATHWRSISLRGTLENLSIALGANVYLRENAAGQLYRDRTGPLHLPAEIAARVEGVFGLLEWPPPVRITRSADPGDTAATAGMPPQTVAARYRFPGTTGKGQTIGLIQLGGKFRPDDFTACMKQNGIDAAIPALVRIDAPEDRSPAITIADVETAIDAQIAGALAPGARLVLYDAPNSERGLLDAVRTALFESEPRPDVLSISYGWPEQVWTPAALRIANELFVAAALSGVTVICASGDRGSATGFDQQPHAYAPASSPFVLACGATQIDPDGSEPVWNQGPAENSGGGFSEAGNFARPVWQDALTADAPRKDGRGVPDVAAQTVPGYPAVIGGKTFAAMGTSAVAPMWAALVARINEQLVKNAGFFAPILYAKKAPGQLFDDVLAGTNGAYRAKAGWNPCTGLGVPNGEAIAGALAAN